jgi:S-adenosylmethionine hydrolase
MITLASDFGSPYPAAMKGVVLQETDARLVDVAHDFPRQDVRTTAFWLREVLPWFPPAVHLVVVDPGVGTDRAALAVRAGDHVLVGPDNGVLLPAARRLAGPADDVEAFEVDLGDPASSTFHGRDVFAPAAALVHEAGIDGFEARAEFTPVDSVVDLAFPEPTVERDRAAGEVLVVDGFGNAITNVPGEFLDGRYGTSVSVDGDPAPVEPTYAAVEAGQRLVTVGSHENVELAVNRGRGEDAFGVGVGDAVSFDFD